MAQESADKKQHAEQPSIKVQSIPQPFYGAEDPYIHYGSQNGKTADLTKDAQMPTGLQKTTPATPAMVTTPVQQTKAAGTPPTATPPNKPSAPPAPQARGKRWPLFVILGLIFLLGIGGISWYYLRDTISNQEPALEPVNVPTDEPEPIKEPELQVPTTTVSVPTTTPSEPEIPDSLSGAPLEFSRLIFLNTIDLDADELTDMEEEVFGTDPGIWDSDEDSYYDGQEIINLYNPLGFTPIRLADSGLVQEYVNPNWRYRLYYPVSWELAAVDISADQVLISAPTGDYIEVRAIRKGRQETFRAWFARIVPDQLFTDLISFTTVAKENAYKRRDDLVAYFVQEDVVYVLVYHSPMQDAIPFRHIMQMTFEGFRPNKAIDVNNSQSETTETTTTSTAEISTSTIATTSTESL